MTDATFNVPDFQFFAESIGMEPRESEGDSFEIDLTPVTGEEIRFSFSITGRSIRLIWKRSNGSCVDIFREGATRLWIQEQGRETSLCTDFSLGSLHGTLRLCVFPVLDLRDELLIS